MKRILLVIFALISLNAFSQLQVKEGSFKYVPGGVIDDKEEYTDGNDLPMALIKISTENIPEQERMRLVFVGNRATQIIKKPKTGSMWIYISAEAATFIDIRHPDYGTYKYYLPEKLCDYCVYEMVLQYVESKLELGFLAISSEPTDADIYIDGKHYGKTNNVITDLAVGTHELKLEKEGYSTVTKTFVTTKGETLKLNETLQAVVNKKTYLIVKSDQADARIYIDDELINTHEASKAVDVGTPHTYKIECNLYHSESGTVTVNDRTEIYKKLRPNFGYINISSSPEQGAKAFVDGDYIGLTPIKTDKIKSGSHKVMVMKDMYKMNEKSFVVNDGQTTNATLSMAANFASVTVNTDSNSDIYVDEKYKAKGKWTGKLSEGIHVFEARKNNHKTSKKSMDLVLGENKTITLDAPKPINSEIDINTSPIGTTIYIDGKSYGEAPNYLSNILIGEHELKLVKQGYKEIKKKIYVKEGEALVLNEKLQANSQQPTANSQKTSGNNNVVNGTNQTFTVKGVSFTMIAVEGGTFQMGATSEQGRDAKSKEKPVHSVTLSDYYIGETEVTLELWEAVMGKQRYHYFPELPPVINLSWNDCQEFIRKLNQLTGKNFRLPTEAEWEYAARGGNKSKGYKYSGSNAVDSVAWYRDNSTTIIHRVKAKHLHNVKTKQANELGIYDMSGNVWEWCQDWYGSYSSSSQTNPTGPSSGSFRVLRGGAVNYNESRCRVSYRYSLSPDNTYGGNFGLRLALSQ